MLQRRKDKEMEKIIIFLSLMVIAAGDQVRVDERSNPGIFFNKMGNLSYIKQEWNIFSSIDLTEIFEPLEFYNEVVVRITKSTTDQDFADSISVTELAILQQEIRELAGLKKKLEEVKALYSSGDELFMRRDNGEMISHAILLGMKLLRKKQNFFAFDCHVNSMCSENVVSQSMISLNSDIELLKKALDNYVAETNITTIQQSVTNGITELTISIVVRHKQVATEVIDILTGKTAPLTVPVIREALTTIEEEVKGKSPIEVQRLTAINLREIGKEQIMITQNTIIMGMRVPILEKQVYTYYQMVPMPVFQATRDQPRYAVFVQPQSEYIAVENDNATEYVFFNETDIKHCSKMQQKLLCKNTKPHTIQPQCESELLIKPVYNSYQNCKIESTTEKTIYIKKIGNSGQWFYSIENARIFSAVCGGVQSPLIFRKAGIFSLPTGCQALIKEQIYTGTDLETDFRESYFLPPIQLLMMRESRKEQINEEATKVMHHIDVGYAGSAQIEKLQHMIIAVSIFFTLAIIVMITCGLKKNKRRSKIEPTAETFLRAPPIDSRISWHFNAPEQVCIAPQTPKTTLAVTQSTTVLTQSTVKQPNTDYEIMKPVDPNKQISNNLSNITYAIPKAIKADNNEYAIPKTPPQVVINAENQSYPTSSQPLEVIEIHDNAQLPRIEEVDENEQDTIVTVYENVS